MGASGESIREQLLKLLKPDKRLPTKLTQHGSGASGAKTPRQSEKRSEAVPRDRGLDDWKKGVKPLHQKPGSTAYTTTTWNQGRSNQYTTVIKKKPRGVKKHGVSRDIPAPRMGQRGPIRAPIHGAAKTSGAGATPKPKGNEPVRTAAMGVATRLEVRGRQQAKFSPRTGVGSESLPRTPIAKPPARQMKSAVSTSAKTRAEPLRKKAVPNPALSTESHYRAPRPWVGAGRSLQISPTASRILPIRIGLDFGTAYSKLAIRAASKVFLVDWTGVHDGPHPYILGGEVSTLSDARCVLGRAPEATSCATNLKLPFLELDQVVNDGDLAKAAAFVAWMLVYARAWLYHHQRPLLEGNRLIWELNLGAPTGSWTQGTKLRDRYKRVAMAAWRLSQEDEVSVQRAQQIVNGTHPADAGHGLDALAILPEFAAQIAGYVKSPQRTNGLHLLVDVGAGTLDVACFRIMHDGKEAFKDKFPVFASSVEPLGTHYLMQARLAACGAEFDKWQSTLEVPTCSAFVEATGADLTQAMAADQEFSRLCKAVVSKVVSWTRYVMDKRAEEWKQGLPVFLAGGGAKVGVYKVAVDRAFDLLRIPYKSRRFPLPRDIDGGKEEVTSDLFNRVSVAYGLTFDAEEIGKLIPPSDIPPDYQLPIRGVPDRDELYPK